MLTSECIQNSQRLQAFFQDLPAQFSRSSGFVQRRSKLSSELFVQLFVLGCLETPTATLNSLVQMADQLGLSLSEAGLQQRLTGRAVNLFEQMLAHSLRHWSHARRWPETLLDAFSQVYVLDSTEIRLPSSLAPHFMGKQTAALKVQLSLEYLSGTISALEVTAGRCPDQACRLHVQQATGGSLHLFDLGYFDQQVFAQIDAQGGCFISRLQSQVSLYATPEARTAFDVNTWLHSVTTTGEHTVWLGQQARQRVRLVALRLPEAVVAERRRKAHAKAARWGKTCSQRTLDLLAWACFITNVAAETMSVEAVMQIYGLRWQIELVFKVCKSYARLDEVRVWCVERLLCQLYARLLGLIVFKGLVADWPLSRTHELSLSKAFAIWQRKASVLAAVLDQPIAVLAQVLTSLIRHIWRFGLKNNRQTCPSSLQRILQSA